MLHITDILEHKKFLHTFVKLRLEKGFYTITQAFAWAKKTMSKCDLKAG